MKKTYEIQLVRTNIAEPAQALDNPPAVARYCQYLTRYDREHLLRLDLDTRCQLISRETVHIGTADHLALSAREVFRGALLSGARQIVLVHNHPSGNPGVSDEDLRAAENLKRAGELLNIELTDFIVLGDNGRYWSWKENGEGQLPVPRDGVTPPVHFAGMGE